MTKEARGERLRSPTNIRHWMRMAVISLSFLVCLNFLILATVSIQDNRTVRGLKAEVGFPADSSSSRDEEVLEASITGERTNDRSKERLFAFTIRDARRLVPTQPPSGMHVFDFVDVYTDIQARGKAQLFQDGRVVGDSECNDYSLACYKKKVIQTFDLAMNSTDAAYLFYMESDNELCVPLQHIEDLAIREKRYFIGTGVGASGWIMSRDFVLDFVENYRKVKGDCPDCAAANMLMEMNPPKWSVTRQYLVSHTVLPSLGAKGLTQTGKLTKHLPRCLEPHRGMWQGAKWKGDKFGWDYFDFNACMDADIFPCDAQSESLGWKN